MNGDRVWQTIVRVLAVVGFGVVLTALLMKIEVPWGLFVLLIGMFFGPDVYKHLGPGEEG